MASENTQNVKFNEAKEQRRIRELTRFKNDSGHSFAEDITEDLLNALHKLVNKEYPSSVEEKDTPYPLEWVESKRTLTSALNKFKRYAESKDKALVEDVSMSGADTASAGGTPSSSGSERGPAETSRTTPDSSVPPSKEGGATPSSAPTDTTPPVASPEDTAAPAASNEQTNPIKREGEARPPTPGDAPPAPPSSNSRRTPAPRDAPHSPPPLNRSTPAPGDAPPAPPSSNSRRTPAPRDAPHSPPPLNRSSPSPGSAAEDHELRRALCPQTEHIIGQKLSRPGWQALISECKWYGCDFMDVLFRLEFHCKHEKTKPTSESLLQFARGWMEKCPGALQELEVSFYGDADLYEAYHGYRTSHPRTTPRRDSPSHHSRLGSPGNDIGLATLNGAREQSVFSNNPERDREEIASQSHMAEESPGWDKIVLANDPDVERDPGNSQPVEGKIVMSCGWYLDVALPILLHPQDPTKERHILVLRSDYADEGARFESTQAGNAMTLRTSDRKSLIGCMWNDLTILSISSAFQKNKYTFPITFSSGYITREGPSIPRAWTRSTFINMFGRSFIDEQVNERRTMVGQKPITTKPKLRFVGE
ncbi:Uu.00g130270.m01.CDS01 [Anthostomella pinea]|uniref:Uu.00g130270.m01.CDS01 n=1 Tax=Anthostomella pinea TaxID=933095 RepID=A0AAI8VIK9_9PEZI|nr:Uu.00g130270.m01.CDS01 [Anthostomella pinea]